MEHVLCNTHKLNEAWLVSYLDEYLNKNTKVLYLILDTSSSYSEEMLALEEKYSEGKREYEALVMPLENYGVKRSNIKFFFLHETSLESLKDLIKEYDVVIAYGSGDVFMIEDVLYEAFNSYEGLYIGINEGALVALDIYHNFEDEYESFDGIGLLSGFALDILYKERENHIANLIRFLEESDQSIVAFSDSGGGLMISEGSMELLGDAFILNGDNLDELYNALETLRIWS